MTHKILIRAHDSRSALRIGEGGCQDHESTIQSILAETA